MFKTTAEKYIIDEKTMEKGSLRSLFWLLVGSVPAFPIIAIVDSIPLMDAIGMGWLADARPEGSTGIFMLGFLVSMVCFFVAGFNKLINRLWMPNKYLDEWEVRQKQASMAFAFQFVIYTAVAILALRAIFEENGWIAPVEVSFTVSMFAVLWLAFYAFAFHVVANVEPIERDELAKPEVYDWQLDAADRPKRKRRLTPSLVVSAIVVILVLIGTVTQSLEKARNHQAAVDRCTSVGSSFSPSRYDVTDWKAATCADGSRALPSLSD